MSTAATILRARLFSKLGWNYSNVDSDGLAALDIDSLQAELVLRPVDGVRPINLLWHDERTVGVVSGTDYIDLNEIITDLFGSGLSYSQIMSLMVVNLSTIDGDNLLIGGAGAAGNGWGSPFNSNQNTQLVLQANSPVLLGCRAGLGVTGTQKVLKISYAGISASIGFFICLIGKGITFSSPFFGELTDGLGFSLSDGLGFNLTDGLV